MEETQRLNAGVRSFYLSSALPVCPWASHLHGVSSDEKACV